MADKLGRTSASGSSHDCVYIELDHCVSRNELVQRLRNVTRVREVKNCISKCDQSLLDGYGETAHYLQTNVLVQPFSSQHFIEFELNLSHCHHATVSVAFKKSNHEEGLLLEAWRILRAVAGDNALFPRRVQSWYDDILAQFGDSEMLRVLLEVREKPHSVSDFSSEDSDQQGSLKDSSGSDSPSIHSDSQDSPAPGAAAADMLHLKTKPWIHLRYQYVFTKKIDEIFEGRTQFFVHLVKQHYQPHLQNSRVFEYNPFTESWRKDRWTQSRRAIQEIRDSSNLAEEYEQLLSELPAATVKFYDCMPHSLDVTPVTTSSRLSFNDCMPQTRAWALVKLSELHRGEVVQISHHQSQWRLEEGSCPEPPSQQLRCESQAQPLAGNSGKRKNQLDSADEYDRWQDMAQIEKCQRQEEYGRTDTTEIQIATEDGVIDAGFAGWDSSRSPLLPDWDRQKYLCVVPCRAREDCHWRREMLCSTLGDMFRVLGKEHSAASIYDFYQTRKIAVRKLADCERRQPQRKRIKHSLKRAALAPGTGVCNICDGCHEQP